MKFTIPLPVTTNHAYATGGGRWYKTAKVKAWEEEAGWAIKNAHNGKTITRAVRVDLFLYLKRDRDIDGSIKPILDLLQAYGVYENDSQILDLRVKKTPSDNPRVEITIFERAL